MNLSTETLKSLTRILLALLIAMPFILFIGFPIFLTLIAMFAAFMAAFIGIITTIAALGFSGLAIIAWFILRSLEAHGFIHGAYDIDQASYCFEMLHHGAKICSSFF